VEPFEVIEAVRPWVDPVELQAWRAQRSTRILLVGRTASGKTTLRNRLLGRDDPVGLGGSTRSIDAQTQGRKIWVDTPGIDGRDRAIDQLGPCFDTADLVVWVVDGLQPLTRTEREVVELLMLPGTPLAVVLSRADLLGDEVEAVLERVRRGTQALHPFFIGSGDLRSDSPDLRGAPRSPRQQQQLLDALHAVRRRFEALPQPLSPERLEELIALRPVVRAWLDRWAARTRRMTVGERVADFSAGLSSLADSQLVQLAAEPALVPHLASLPKLPVPTEADGLLTTIRLNAAGQAATLRELRAIASSWMAEVQVLLDDWAATLPTDAQAATSWERAHSALDQAIRATSAPLTRSPT